MKMSKFKYCSGCGAEMEGKICIGCGWSPYPKNENLRPLDRCVICGETKDLLPVGIKMREGGSRVDWYCEPHYLKRVENMSKTSKDLSWCKVSYHKAPNPDVVKAIVKEGDLLALLKSCLT